MNKIHRGIRPYICDQCGASYGEESELKTHMARHDDAKKYHCMYCDYTTQEKGNYQSKYCFKTVHSKDINKMYSLVM